MTTDAADGVTNYVMDGATGYRMENRDCDYCFLSFSTRLGAPLICPNCGLENVRDRPRMDVRSPEMNVDVHAPTMNVRAPSSIVSKRIPKRNKKNRSKP